MKLTGKTNHELIAMITALQALPENRMPPGSVCLYTPACTRKTDAIARQITHNISVARAAAGNPVVADGYSGRQSNRH